MSDETAFSFPPVAFGRSAATVLRVRSCYEIFSPMLRAQSLEPPDTELPEQRSRLLSLRKTRKGAASCRCH